MPAGRPPKPTALTLICNRDHEHNSQCTTGRRVPNSQEPTVPADYVPPPDWLSDHCKEAYNAMVPQLIKAGLWSSIDMRGLAIMLDQYETAIECRALYLQFGYTYVSDAGVVRARPEVAMSKGMFDSVKKWCTEFGLTPASRSRIRVGIAGGNQDTEKDKDEKGFFRSSNVKTKQA